MLELQARPEVGTAEELAGARDDERFRVLLGESQWRSLPAAVRARFSKRLSGGASVIYTGTVSSIRFSRLGWLLANLLRLAGAPLPLCRTTGMKSVVAVTEDAERNGQFWIRMFSRTRGFPQIITSSKRFCGPTGLEEAIGFGIVIGLSVSVRSGALVFESAQYHLDIAGLRLTIPKTLSPGILTVAHTEVTAETFVFSLHLEHALFGELVHQEVVYRDGGLEGEA